MPLSSNAKSQIADALIVDFYQYLNEDCNVELSEFLANSALDYLTRTFGGQMDAELENELATTLIEHAYIAF